MPRLVNIDRDTPLLLPPDLRQWVPEDDIVQFVIAAVDRMRLPSLKVNRRGSGSEQYPPKMMLALLIYCYTNGIFSSRRIERATHRDIAVRYLTANTHPDHDTICTFRRENLDVVSEAFEEILLLARRMGILKVGTVSIDGSKIRANASKDKNVRYDRCKELEAQLRRDIQELLLKANQADNEDREEGQQLPKEIARREALLEKLERARAESEAEAKAKADAERAEFERKLAARQQRNGKGKPPQPPQETPKDNQQMNLTDHDSRLMARNGRSSPEQCYNAQAAVDADGTMLVVGAHVSQCASDANELVPALGSISEAVGRPSAVLADSGYLNGEAIEQLASGEPPIDAFIAVGRDEASDRRRYEFRPIGTTAKPDKHLTDPQLLAMREKLRTDEGRKRYARRKQSVEPCFGIIKQAMGFRQFLLRGHAKVSGEWTLVTLAYNVRRLLSLMRASDRPVRA
jgi:transposase